MTVRIAINGFGRIGRNIVRAIYESGRKDIDVVAVNDLGPVETNAHLLQYDSVHGRFPQEVKVSGDTISVGKEKFKVLAERDPAKLPWKDLGIDIVLECTGIFTSKEKASAHLTAGAKRVIVSAPADGADLTVVYGINDKLLSKDHIVISNGSCTTNCLAPMAKVMNELVGIEKGRSMRVTRNLTRRFRATARSSSRRVRLPISLTQLQVTNDAPSLRILPASRISSMNCQGTICFPSPRWQTTRRKINSPSRVCILR